jgi:cytochrome P450
VYVQAGAETSSTTLLWCVLYLTQYAEVQEKCFQEISTQVRMKLSTNQRPYA